MYVKLQENSFLYFLFQGILTWIIFLISFLLLTEGIMYFMELEGQALLFFLVAIFFLILNYFNLRSIVYFKPSATFKANVAVYNYHQIIVSLERVFRVIVILTSLGFLSSLSTFFFISMEYFTFKSLNYLFTLLPLLFIVYLIFAIPSFYGLKELNQIKYFLKQFKEIKNDVKTQFMTN